MGLKTLFRYWGSLFFVFLLIITQTFFIVNASAENNSQNTSSIQKHPINPIGPYEPNDVYYSCIDLLVVDDFVIADSGISVDFLNLSDPRIPRFLYTSNNYGQQLKAYTSYDNIVLFGLENGFSNNSIMKIDLDIDSTTFSEIGFLNNWLFQMSLTNDSLFSFSYMNHGFSEFLIHNATNIDNLTLLGNSTLSGIDSYPHFVVHDDFVYFTSQGRNLSIYQVNSSCQLSFIHQYLFSQLNSIYFHENYLFTCHGFGFQVYDFSNPANLTLVTHYNISSAQSIRISNDVAYLTTSNSFTTLDVSNIMDIQLLDQYLPGEKERVEMWKIELSGNLAIILTKDMWYFDYSGDYGGYLYIFDISSPTEIKRIYPVKIPLLDSYDKFILKIVLLLVVLPIVIILIPTSIFLTRFLKKKRQKKKELN